MKRLISLVVCVFLLLSAVAIAENATTELQGIYAEAELLMAQGDYSGAASKFEALGAYSDASQMAMYCKAIAAAETLGMYDVAVMTFENLGDFRDSKQMVTYYTARRYEAVADAVEIKTASDAELVTAIELYIDAEKNYTELALFKDCITRLAECQDKRDTVRTEQADRAKQKQEEIYQKAIILQEDGKYQDAIDLYKTISAYKDICRGLQQYEEKKKQASKERGKMTNELRYQILQRDGFRCQICGRSQEHGVTLHIDHIKPVSKGGKTIAENLRTLCEECNLGNGKHWLFVKNAIRKSIIRHSVNGKPCTPRGVSMVWGGACANRHW